MKKILILVVLLVVSCHGAEKEVYDKSIYFEKICIGGHIYWRQGNIIVIKLNNDGTPVRCMTSDIR